MCQVSAGESSGNTALDKGGGLAHTILHMDSIATQLIAVGGLLLLALALEAFGRHTRLPRISLLVLLGFVLGPSVLAVMEPGNQPGLDTISILALSMVGFLVGGKLSVRMLQRVGHLVLWFSLWEVAVTFAVVAGGLLLLSQPLELALLLAAIATATDPAATLDAIRESGRSNRFSETLTGIVAIDDAWCLILFSLVLVVLQAASNSHIELSFLFHGMAELAGSIALGVVLGLPFAFVSGRIRRGEPTLLEALGMVMICGGLANWLGLSYLLACVCLGVTVVNLARHHSRPFHAIEEIEWPFLALFFIYAGSWLTLDALKQGGLLCLAYFLLRLVGRVSGGLVAGLPRWVDSREALWTGGAMLPQGGVAMALAFVAAGIYPHHATQLGAVVVSAVFFYELLGPLATRISLNQID